MSRTFRRKDFSPFDIAKRGYLYGENDVWAWDLEPKWKNPFYRRPAPSSYEEYKKTAINQFHRDASSRYYVNYNSAPKEYRNIRNRSLRTTHRNELHKIKLLGDGELTPFTHNVGWDYW